MIEKLIKLAKFDFDTAFLLADKYKLSNELLHKLNNGHDLYYDTLKRLMYVKYFFYYNEVYIDVCYNVRQITISFEGFRNLSLRNNLLLESLSIRYTNLELIDINNNKKLKHLDVHSNNLKQIDVSNNIELIILDVSMNKIQTLNLQNNKNITELNCSFNLIEELDLTNNLKLTHINCECNDLLKTIKLNKAVKGLVKIFKENYTQVIYVD